MEEKISLLYEKDSSASYQNLLELEMLSEQESTLYGYFNVFLELLDSEKYALRVRGYRLLCKQAKWDVENKINHCIDKILDKIEDTKPTAVRQNIKALQEIVRHKEELRDRIKEKMLAINTLQYKDTMQPLIEKDIEEIVTLIKNKQKF